MILTLNQMFGLKLAKDKKDEISKEEALKKLPELPAPPKLTTKAAFKITRRKR